MEINKATQIGVLAAAKTAEGIIKRRIFNEGRAVSGRIGAYRSRSYRAKRNKAGRQTGYKDLEFDGDLRRAIQTGKSSKGAVLGFVNDRAADISTYQEDQTNKKIFKLGDAGIKASRAAFVRGYRNAIRRG